MACGCIVNFDVYSQTSISKNVAKFSSDCKGQVGEFDDGEIPAPDFELLNYQIVADTTVFKFIIKANCFDQNVGVAKVNNDSLHISRTNVHSDTTYSKSIDSLGKETFDEIITEEVLFAMCWCHIEFTYQFDIPLHNIRFLVYNNRVYELKPQE